MKRLAFGSVMMSVGMVLACGSESGPPSVGGGGAAGAAGSAPTAGSNTGGAPTGGAPTGGAPTGGAPTAGSAGANTAGAPGGGAGGSMTAGAGGGTMAGAGGGTMAGAGGSMTAGAGGSMTAGAGGMMAAGAGGGGAVTLDQLVGKLDGRLIVMPCGDQPGTDDCQSAGAMLDGGPLVACTNSQLNVVNDYRIGGTPGATYNVTMHFYGIMEPKNYGTAAMREAGTTRPQNNNNGATPVPWANAVLNQQVLASNYNTYEIHVLDNNMQEKAAYFINSDTGEGHYTFVINYEKTIPIIGGGVVRMRTFDANCRQIKNCSGGTTPCSSKARSLSVTAAMPQPPMNALQQPGLGVAAEHSGQWFLLDVVRFTGPM